MAIGLDAMRLLSVEKTAIGRLCLMPWIRKNSNRYYFIAVHATKPNRKTLLLPGITGITGITTLRRLK